MNGKRNPIQSIRLDFFSFFLVSIQSHTHTQRHIPKNKQQQKFVRFTWLNFKYQYQKNSLNYASVGCFFLYSHKSSTTAWQSFFHSFCCYTMEKILVLVFFAKIIIKLLLLLMMFWLCVCAYLVSMKNIIRHIYHHTKKM